MSPLTAAKLRRFAGVLRGFAGSRRAEGHHLRRSAGREDALSAAVSLAVAAERESTAAEMDAAAQAIEGFIKQDEEDEPTGVHELPRRKR